MSQSVNRGEKSAASEAVADAIKTIVPVEPAETAQDSDAEQPEAQAASETASAQAVSSDDTPTVDLDDADSDDVEDAPAEGPDDGGQVARQPGQKERDESEASAKEDTTSETTVDGGAKAARDDAATTVATTDDVTDASPSDSAVEPDPVSAEPAAAEPVATPTAVSVVNEAATPAEALSPYDSPQDLPGGDAAAQALVDEASERTPWSPDSGTMPPSIAPKSPSSAQSPPVSQPDAVEAAAPVAAADEEIPEASFEPTEIDVEPVIEAAFPATLPEPAGQAAKKAEKRTDGVVGALAASRRRRLGPAACAAGAAALLLAWGGIAWWTTQHIASGTSVSGVDVSGLGPQEARERISKGVGDRLAQPVTLTVGQGSAELVPAGSGVSVDAKASVKKLTGFTLNPVALAQRLGGQRTDAVIRIDASTLRGALEDRVDTMANGAVSATVTLEGTKPVTTPASNGVGLDVDASLKQLSTWPLGQKTIAMAEGTAVPAITDEEATKFVDGTLTPLLSSGLTVDGQGAGAPGKSAGAAAAFSPEDTAGMLKISSEGGTLSATFDSTALHDAVVARIGQVETPAQNATWKIDGSATGAPKARPQYVASAQGKVIDTAALSASLLKAGTSATDVAGRTVALPMVVAEPTVTTPQNEWGISEMVGEYATPYNSGDAPRTQNLTRGAELVNGTVVKPGEVFSLEKVLGEVDYEHGFADAGVISNGQHVDSLGGGLSQVATTVFNAGFEAGMDDTEHHAHQYYFDRYPAGREATLWTGKLDVKFTNSTSNSVLVQAWLDGEQIHVRMWSTKYYDVSITSSDRFNFRPVSTERKSGPGCEPYSGGNPGFDITITRSRKHDGKALPDDVLTTQYAADNDIVCS
ncbi:VanW family protein [Actinomyces naeslundii]|uniref:VanW family protein n=2 Tax=Actinomyces naeslundii TaxID=1655 RepID=UPI00096F7684|nr:VanW family protein [Actinomyces naeslundii]OMG34012.1 transcriptional initiation protein Tat [Actinomyces naeslundii]PKY96394.1 transcriptional initiation protein Tat [Actinomyces naeslundii]